MGQPAPTIGSRVNFLQGQRNTMRLVERIGGGDSFAAGSIHGFLSGRSPEATPHGAWRPAR